MSSSPPRPNPADTDSPIQGTRVRDERHAPVLLDATERLAFERLLTGLRLVFLLSAPLVPLAFGPSAVPFGVLIAVAASGSSALTWALLRWTPALLLRWQLALRLFDCALVAGVLTQYHAYLGDAYYDSAYLLFVVAAAATHGRHGAVLVGTTAALAALGSRIWLMVQGPLAAESRHFTDTAYYLFFFLAIGVAIAHLMEKGGEVVARRELPLREEMARLAEKNAGLYEQARAAVETRDTVLATASHDLKNPLQAIKAYVQLLQQEIAGGAAPQHARLVQRLSRIGAAARKMQFLADELADTARLQMGEKLLLEISETDLVALARQMLDELRDQAGRRKLHLEAEVASLHGYWDHPRLERMLSNLLSNSLKYSPADGIVRVSVGSDYLGDEPAARLTVSDEGVGIPESELQRVEQPYARATNVGGIPGSGLGLAGARAIIEQHGGSLHIDSREGAGTTITVRLPVTPHTKAELHPTDLA